MPASDTKSHSFRVGALVWRRIEGRLTGSQGAPLDTRPGKTALLPMNHCRSSRPGRCPGLMDCRPFRAEPRESVGVSSPNEFVRESAAASKIRSSRVAPIFSGRVSRDRKPLTPRTKCPSIRGPKEEPLLGANGEGARWQRFLHKLNGAAILEPGASPLACRSIVPFLGPTDSRRAGPVLGTNGLEHRFQFFHTL